MSTTINATIRCQYCNQFLPAGYVEMNGKPAHLACMLDLRLLFLRRSGVDVPVPTRTPSGPALVRPGRTPRAASASS